jgi:photosystem II stability/assembly factor-like uncharacterized protein
MARKLKQRSYKLCGLLFVAFQLSCGSLPSQKPLQSEHGATGAPGVRISGIQRVGDVPTAEENCPSGVRFVSDNDGWFFCGDRLWQTSDGGKSWRSIYPANGIGRTFGFYQFIDRRNGWRCSATEVQKTDDGGSSWTTLSSPIDQGNGEISSVRFLRDGKRGWLTGGLYYPLTPGAPENDGLQHVYQNMRKAPRGVVFSTDDGGLNWRRQFISPHLGSFVHYVYESPDQQIWATDDTSLYRLEDGIWKLLDFEKGNCVKRQLLETVGLDRSHHDIYEITALFLDSSGYGWLAFRNGYVARTIDGGKSWCDLTHLGDTQTNPNAGCFISIHFSNSTGGLALSSNGKLYQSNDGGISWSSIDPNHDFQVMFFLSASRGWAAGRGGLFHINM